eukprot:s2572_g4.t1
MSLSPRPALPSLSPAEILARDKEGFPRKSSVTFGEVVSTFSKYGSVASRRHGGIYISKSLKIPNRFSTISVRLSKSHAESCAAAVTFANALFLWGQLFILCGMGREEQLQALKAHEEAVLTEIDLLVQSCGMANLIESGWPFFSLLALLKAGGVSTGEGAATQRTASWVRHVRAAWGTAPQVGPPPPESDVVYAPPGWRVLALERSVSPDVAAELQSLCGGVLTLSLGALAAAGNATALLLDGPKGRDAMRRFPGLRVAAVHDVPRLDSRYRDEHGRHLTRVAMEASPCLQVFSDEPWYVANFARRIDVGTSWSDTSSTTGIRMCMDKPDYA